jgi:dTDP-4-amino-4,6-dideoxygalactose transaminase
MAAVTGAANQPHVPQADLGLQFEAIRKDAETLFRRIGSAGSFVLGAELAAFEEEFATYCGVGHCVGVASGTDALLLALRALGAGPGTEVVTVPFTFFATLEAIVLAGARPVLVDVDSRTRCLDASQLASAITPATAAVIPVHLFGRPAPVREIAAICDAAGVPVLDDAAQAHGAEVDGQRAGAWSRVTAFSFYPTKNLGALGDGGAVVTPDGGLAAAVRSLRHHGSAPNDASLHGHIGYASRLDDLQAGLLRLKLRRLDEDNDARRRVAERYWEGLAGLPIGLPAPDDPRTRQVFHHFCVEVEERERVMHALRAAGIGFGLHYPRPVHLQPAAAAFGWAAGDFPVSERLGERALSLPVFPGITDEQVDRVVEALAAAVAG